jgi:L-aspartate oxidase
MLEFDVIIIGSGLAGMSVALRLAKLGKKIALISKKNLEVCNSFYAQGGIAAVIDQHDSFAEHIHDTLVAGAGLCNPEVVKFIVEQAPSAIEWLVQNGVEFTLDQGNKLHLTREGGHSQRRVLHIADATGAGIITTLYKQILADKLISIYENHIGIDLVITHAPDGIKCNGIYVYDEVKDQVYTFVAPQVVLATGGAGKAYLYTTNPDVATGDGIAMAYRVGCAVANMEFIQFHPTCLYHEKAKSFLISEAVRGEGGLLTLPDGQRFMLTHDPRMELAPRDIVARAIDFEMKKYGLNHVFLDISHKPAAFIKEHFPNIYSKCIGLGIDITTEQIPVVPAAHYTCGGIVTDVLGRTAIDGLYAVGECAHTGLHGANRLASNSLLECLVIGKGLVEDIVDKDRSKVTMVATWKEPILSMVNEEVIIAHDWDELRRVMWDYVGIVRSNKRLKSALQRVALLKEEIHEYYLNCKLSTDLIELRNLILVCELIIKSAMKRKESRGLHYSLDYPNTKSNTRDTVLQ